MNLSRFKALVLSCMATVAFVGCGGGSDSTATAPVVATGTFVDAPVQGLKYTTATQSGYTDSNGTYKFVAGEQIEFFLGNLSLGKVTASALTTPYTMAGDTNISNPSDKAKNIAMLLQNFDANRSDSAVLDVSKLKDYNFSDVNLSVTTAAMETKITALLGTLGTLIDSSHPLINATTASTAMKTYVADATLKSNAKFTAEYLSGKTFYAVQNWVGEGWQTFETRFGSDGQVTWVNTMDGTFTEPYEITSDGKLKVTPRAPDPVFYLTIKSVTADYIEYTPDDSTISEYFYFDKAKADAKFAQLQNQVLATTKKFTENYLQSLGNHYVMYRDWDNTLNQPLGWVGITRKLDSGKSYEMEGFVSLDTTLPLINKTYTLENGKIKQTDSSGTWYSIILDATTDYVLGCDLDTGETVCQDQAKFYIFKDKAKADAKFAQLVP